MLDFAREMLAYLRRRRKFWLFPVLLAMVLLGGLLVLTQGSALAPFVYTLF